MKPDLADMPDAWQTAQAVMQAVQRLGGRVEAQSPGVRRLQFEKEVTYLTPTNWGAFPLAVEGEGRPPLAVGACDDPDLLAAGLRTATSAGPADESSAVPQGEIAGWAITARSLASLTIVRTDPSHKSWPLQADIHQHGGCLIVEAVQTAVLDRQGEAALARLLRNTPPDLVSLSQSTGGPIVHRLAVIAPSLSHLEAAVEAVAEAFALWSPTIEALARSPELAAAYLAWTDQTAPADTP